MHARHLGVRGTGCVRAAAVAPSGRGVGPRLVLDTGRPEWHADPALPCKSDPDLWFADAEPAVTAAVRLCRTRCPRLVECGAEALARQEPYGVWGGVTAAERDRAVRGVRGARQPRVLRECAHPAQDRRARATGSLYCVGCARERAREAREASGARSRADWAAETTAKREALLGAYHLLADQHLPRRDAAALLGVTDHTLKGVLRTARLVEDPRAVPHGPPPAGIGARAVPA